MVVLFSLVLAALFAMNIGASGTAAAMGVPYGGGFVRKRFVALVLVALCACAGAVIGGGAVTETLSDGLTPKGGLTPVLILIVIGSACCVLSLANLLGVPLSTSEVTVGSVVGVAMALGSLDGNRLLHIVVAWIALPLLTFVVVALLRRVALGWLEIRLAASPREDPIKALLKLLVVGSGCYQAFSAGTNNVGNAAGPLVGSGILTLQQGLIYGGIFLAAGALLMGSRVLETSGKRITRLSLLDGSLVAVVTGTMVVAASLLGLPVPLTQIAMSGIVAVGWAKGGMRAVDQDVIVRMGRIWLTSPLASFFLSLGAAMISLGSLVWIEAIGSLACILLSFGLLAVQAHGGAIAKRSSQPA